MIHELIFYGALQGRAFVAGCGSGSRCAATSGSNCVVPCACVASKCVTMWGSKRVLPCARAFSTAAINLAGNYVERI